MNAYDAENSLKVGFQDSKHIRGWQDGSADDATVAKPKNSSLTSGPHMMGHEENTIFCKQSSDSHLCSAVGTHSHRQKRNNDRKDGCKISKAKGK